MPFSIKLSPALLTLFLVAPLPALAMNDWSVPCTQGQCSWDLPSGSGTSGSVQIWGSVSAISDITAAAGWDIITTCNSTSSNQDIQLVCEDNNPDCNHLFQGSGAVNTIVRLPESCGPNPFARVAQYQVVQSNLVTRDNGSEVPVHQLTLDTDFSAADPSQGGEVYFSLQGQNWQGDSNTVNRRRLRPLARQSNESIVAAVNYSGQGNLYRTGSGSIDMNANLQASVSMNVVTAGTIFPPKVTQFQITIGLDGNADGTLSIVGNISGQIPLGGVTLFQSYLPGLSFPSILEIGPQFTLSTSMVANFALQNVNTAIEVNYDLGGTSYAFPPAETLTNTDGITSSSRQVTFTVNPDVGVTLGATTHLTSQVGLGLNALDIVSANIYLFFDTALGLQGNVSSTANPQPCLSGNAEISVGVGAKGTLFGLLPDSNNETIYDEHFPLFQECFSGNLL